MEGNCSDPPSGWTPWPQKSSQRLISHLPREAPRQSTQNLWDWGSPYQAWEGHPPWCLTIHQGRRSLRHRPQILPHHQPGPTGLLFLPQVMWVHQVHVAPQDSLVPSPPGIGFIPRGPAPTRWPLDWALLVRHPDRPRPGQQEELHLGQDRLSLQIRVPGGLPNLSGCQHLPPHIVSWVPGHHPGQRLSCHQPGAPLHQRLGYYHSPQCQDPSSGRDQTQVFPRIFRDTLYLLWQSYLQAPHGGTKSHPHDHWLVALARIHGLHSTTYHVLQRRRLGAYEPTTLVFTPLSILLSTKPTQHPIHAFADPGPIHLTKWYPFFTDQPKLHPTTLAPRHHYF